MNTKNSTPAVPDGVPLGVGEVMELIHEFVETVGGDMSNVPADRTAGMNLLAAITKLVSDRDVLLSAMTTISTAQQSTSLLAYVRGVANAAIQKVSA